jgi:hypothetical protein
MIREYHIVLGSIFYDQKRFSSDGIDNAEFQLSRALSPAFGPIINPELRRMLAYVYEFNGNKEGMMTENIRAIMDMLRLDRVDEAKQVITDVAQYTADLPETYTTQLGALDRIQRLRSTCADPEGISFEDQSAVHQFLIDRQKQQDQQSTILDPEFVNEQYFKALSDQGQNIPETHPEWKQLMYSQALLRIANQDQLGSYEDYARLQRIRQSLASTLDRPELLSTTRFNKEANLKYKGTGAGEEYKSFVIPSLGQEIQIPQSMFRLNETVDEYYQPTVDNPPTTTMMPKIQYEEKTYKVIKYTDTPKEEAHQPVQQIIPQQQMQKNIVVEKEMMKVRPKG